MRKKAVTLATLAIIALAPVKIGIDNSKNNFENNLPKTIEELSHILGEKSWDGEQKNICFSETASLSANEKIIAGEEVTPTREIRAITKITKSVTRTPKPVQKPEGDYKIVFVPVNYVSDVYTPLVSELIENIGPAFSGLPVEFVQLPSSVPASISLVNHHPTINNKDKERIKKIISSYGDNFILVVNDDADFGAAHIGDYSIISSRAEGILYTTIHEIGHMLGLDDLYFYKRPKTRLDGPQLFLPQTELSLDILTSYLETDMLVYKTNYTCDGKPVFSFDNQDNVMARVYTNEQVRMAIEQGNLFTDFQIEYMKGFAEKKAKQR